MNDRRTAAGLDRLRSRPHPDALPRGVRLPDYGGSSIDAIPDLVLATLGRPSAEGPLVQAVDPQRFDRVLLVILDGLGFHRVLRYFDEQPDAGLARLAERGVLLPVTSVFPSTTVAALTTYSTGLAPITHGMIGYRLYLREISAITNMIQLSVVGGDDDSATRSGLDIDALLPCPTLYEKLRDLGVTTHTLLPRYIAASGLSRILYRGATHIHPAVNLSDMLTLARHTLERASGPTLVTLYWPGLDSIAHVRGPDSAAYCAEITSVDAAIEHELTGRVDRTLLVLSADHGFVTMTPENYRPLTSIPGLSERAILRPVGEPRASYVYLRNTDSQEPWIRPTALAGGLVALSAEEALRFGLLGPGTVHPEVRSRIGDVVVVSTGDDGLYHPYTDSPYLRGMHGGLTEDELYVPLVVCPL